MTPTTERERAVSRRKKRWSARLRTAGALLLLLGAVALADTLLAPFRGGDEVMPRAVTPTHAPLWAALASLAAGALLFATGRRWGGAR